MLEKNLRIPPEVSRVTRTLSEAGFEAYFVGGCVRDLLRGVKPKDWDVTTNATPEEIVSLFSDTFYENNFGTVTVENADAEEPSYRNIEVTPYRLEAKYSNQRHPDSVSFSKDIKDDLKRRDFTINAIAFDPSKGHLIDLYAGQEDIVRGLVRAVGDPNERLSEDALRMLRAVRIATELEFNITRETLDAIRKNAILLKNIAAERIQTEVSRVIMSKNPKRGFELMEECGILEYIIPELREGLGTEQNGDHIYDVWEHNLRAVQHAADREWPLHVRLGALLHDIAKPKTRLWSKDKDDWTFYGHDVVGGRMAKNILSRLKYPKKITETVSKLVRYHLFFTDIDTITLSAVRRLIAGVGKENVWDLMKIRACDRIGMGRPKEKPYRLRKYESMIEEAMRAPVSVGMLKIDGLRVIEVAKITPGPKIGHILHALLEDVLDDPTKNEVSYLEKRVSELAILPDEDLEKLGEKGKERREEEEEAEIHQIRKRYSVS